jgi:hypothetical protein
MTDTQPASPPKIVKFRQALEGFLGKVVTVVNPESYEDAPVGHRLTTGFYRAKVVDLGEDVITLVTEYVHAHEKSKEPVKQYVPLDKIKRLSVMKSERVIHI